MCGICGTVGFSQQQLVEKMNLCMAHRGPDYAGIYRDQETYLGHTRLSIIDLSSSAHQPMSNEDETVWITFNGEIYNFLELRKNLLSMGHCFKSDSDTEVIIHLYEEYGEGCLAYLRGMFAFAIWDRKLRKIFAARDRLGIKPFFYYLKENKFIFASELKAILSSGVVKKVINPDAVRGFFIYGAVGAPETLVEDIFTLLPGHYLTLENYKLNINRYWQINYDGGLVFNKTEKEVLSRVRLVFEEAVRIKMVSDVPLGVFLSGGIDSSSIVAMMQKNSERPVKTFSIIFEETTYDERRFSQSIAKVFKTDHTEILLKDKDILADMPRIFESMDQPSIDGFNTFVISKAVKNAGITVALSGLGGDELFAGYPSFRLLPRISNVLKPLGLLPQRHKDRIFNSLMPLAGNRSSLKALFCAFKCRDLRDLYFLKRAVFLPEEVSQFLSCAPEAGLGNLGEENFKKSDAINFLSFLEITNYLQNMLLEDTDRMSMANSLEVRVPFLDHKLVEEMFTIPASLKIGRDYPKRLLVKTMKDFLPDEIYRRPKMGFVLPFEKWIRGELKDYCEERISKENLKRIPFLDYGPVNKIWTDFLKGSKLYNYSSILAIISFVNWYERNFIR